MNSFKFIVAAVIGSAGPGSIGRVHMKKARSGQTSQEEEEEASEYCRSDYGQSARTAQLCTQVCY